MDTIIQLVSALGPVALAIMGVTVSLRVPSPHGRGSFGWVLAFAVVGIVTAVCTFYEFRGTDTVLSQLWTKVAEAKGPRLRFAGVSVDSQSQSMDLYFSNTSDVDAVGYNLYGAMLVVSHDDNSELEKEFATIKTNLAKTPNLARSSLSLGKGYELVKVTFPIPAKEAMPAITSGQAHGYIVAVAIYVGADTPA